MKNQFLSGSKVIAIAISLCLFSCSNENDVESTPVTKQAKYIPAPIVLPTSSLEWDESYHPYEQRKSLSRSLVNHSHEMAVTNSNIYVGNMYSKQKMNILLMP